MRTDAVTLSEVIFRKRCLFRELLQISERYLINCNAQTFKDNFHSNSVIAVYIFVTIYILEEEI